MMEWVWDGTTTTGHQTMPSEIEDWAIRKWIDAMGLAGER